MGTLVLDGTSSGLVKYTNGGAEYIKIVIAHITSYYPTGVNRLEIKTTGGTEKLNLADEAAVTTAIALLDTKF
jgi:hypothetical protein